MGSEGDWLFQVVGKKKGKLDGFPFTELCLLEFGEAQLSLNTSSTFFASRIRSAQRSSCSGVALRRRS